VWQDGVTIRKDGTVVNARTYQDYYSPKLVEARKAEAREQARARREWKKRDKAERAARLRAIQMDPHTYLNKMEQAINRQLGMLKQMVTELNEKELADRLLAEFPNEDQIWFKGVTDEFRSPVQMHGGLEYRPGTTVYADSFDPTRAYCSNGIHFCRQYRQAEVWAKGRILAVVPIGEVINPEADKSRARAVRVLAEVTI